MSDSKTTEATKVVINKTVKTFPVLYLLGAVLVVLKALGLTQISWFWTLLPFWFGWAFGLGFIVLILVMVLLVGFVAGVLALLDK